MHLSNESRATFSVQRNKNFAVSRFGAGQMELQILFTERLLSSRNNQSSNWIDFLNSFKRFDRKRYNVQ